MIPIRNIYYMLSYAFSALKEEGYKSMALEEFHNVADLCSAILIKGVSIQLKRGLGKEYIPHTEALTGLKGKTEITESVKSLALMNKRLVCTYDDFSVNFYMNRIIKSTMVLLLKSDIPKHRKKELRKVLVYFSDVELVDIHNINWHFKFNRNNQTYRMLIAICQLVIKGLLQTNSDGTSKLMDFLDDRKMSALYEKFILEFYRSECPKLKAQSAEIKWVLDDGVSDSLLPKMQSDIYLSYKEKILIIDAKCYSHSTAMHFDKRTLHSANLYQIFTYVKNKEAQLGNIPHEVSGMLLYAKTDEEITPDCSYMMSGNRISARTLDLNCEFEQIKSQLIGIATEYFGDSIN